MDPIVEQLSAYIGTLGDLNYLRKRFRNLMIVPCLLHNMMTVSGLATAEDWFEEDENEEERERRQLFENPTPELCKAIARTLYTLACCFKQYGNPGFKTYKFEILGFETEIQRPIPHEEIWRPIWTDTEEMLTIMGLFPFITTEGVRYVIVDRQNQNAWRGRDNRRTELYHDWIDANSANRLIMKILSKEPYPDVAAPPVPSEL
ncbi:MAG: hypothetical protein LBD54_01060 [Puniceicoccales bacterium]|jgi:hypothetical protein|nr:hypothetical protein [Puniceicoccales bacterium]